MKMVKRESIGIHQVWNTNVEGLHNYISANGVINHNCVVDAGYQGEVHIHLFNNSDNEVKIPAGEKIAQFVIVPVWHGIPRLVNSIERETTRGAGGFGSSGLS